VRPNQIWIIGAAIVAVGVVVAIGLSINNSPSLPNKDQLPAGLEPKTSSTEFDDVDSDQAILDTLMNNEGLDRETAQFLADTKIQLISANKTFVHYFQTAPDNSTFDVTMRLRMDQTYSPTSEEILAAAGWSNVYDIRSDFVTIDEETTQLTYQYFFPYETMSESLRASIQGTEIGVSTEWGLIPAAQAQSNSKPGVFVDTVTISTIKKYPIPEAGKALSLYSTLESPFKALQMVKDMDSWRSKLDDLRDCAENPTNLLTKKLYDEHPEEKARLVGEIEDARSEVDSNTAVRIMNLGAKTSFSLASGGDAGGHIVTPVKIILEGMAAQNEAMLKAVTEERVQDAIDTITPCDSEGSDVGTIPAALVKPLQGSYEYRYAKTENKCDELSGICTQTTREIVASGTFLATPLFIDPTSGSHIWEGQGTGRYLETLSSKNTSPPKDHCVGYGLEDETVIKGDGELMVSVATGPGFSRLALYGDAVVNTDSSGSYVHYANVDCVKEVRTKVPAHSEGGSASFKCEFQGIDVVQGGSYNKFEDDGYGTCKLELFPAQ